MLLEYHLKAVSLSYSVFEIKFYPKIYFASCRATNRNTVLFSSSLSLLMVKMNFSYDLFRISGSPGSSLELIDISIFIGCRSFLQFIAVSCASLF